MLTKIFRLFLVVADSILKNMDPSVHPCDDFYQFACGKFLKETQIPEDKTSITTFSAISDVLLDQLKSIMTGPVTNSDIKPFKLAKYLYKACMDKSKFFIAETETTWLVSLPVTMYIFCFRQNRRIRSRTSKNDVKKIGRMAGIGAELGRGLVLVERECLQIS